jgi:hypothetical protein
MIFGWQATTNEVVRTAAPSVAVFDVSGSLQVLRVFELTLAAVTERWLLHSAGCWRSEGALEFDYVFQDGAVFVYQVEATEGACTAGLSCERLMALHKLRCWAPPALQRSRWTRWRARPPSFEEQTALTRSWALQGKVDCESKTFRGRWYPKGEGWEQANRRNRGTFALAVKPKDRPWHAEPGNATLATSLRAYLEVRREEERGKAGCKQRRWRGSCSRSACTQGWRRGQWGDSVAGEE